MLRYRVDETDDGFSGEEGTFTICSFWLVSALVEIGELERARGLCEKLLSYASPLPLYAEQIDAMSGRHLGNFPQAFTHLALINAVVHVIDAEQQPDSSVDWAACLRTFRRRPVHLRSEGSRRGRAGGRPFLHFTDGDDRQQQLFGFESGSSVSVGRQPSVRTSLLDWDEQVSRVHARFERVGGRLGASSTTALAQRHVRQRRARERQATPERRRHAPLRRNPGDLPSRTACRSPAPDAGGARGRGPGGPSHPALDHPAPRARGALPPVQGSQRLRQPGRRRADRRGAVPGRRCREGPSQGAVRQARRRGGARERAASLVSSSAPSPPA